eukprot:CAMPEP_0168607710 /NCGR_PEP_ID=MMETSP0449_2-20121227/206_1 /TAXON_ID=1082188 /ORGANISM="Strombidium rassoulzadegani, Strain ras09" /LENGTH=243 /DNA_ID=CAMNT_0008647581 /DNA_START=264 /DNA_END=995 /DNA_ORIENTATION=-
MSPNATATAACAHPSLPLHQHPSAFQGDGEGMVLVDACVRAKEAQREQALVSGASPPRVGRDLVPYFNPDSTDWGLEDVNTNTTDDAESDGSSRGYDSCTSTGVRRRGGGGEVEKPKVPSKGSKSRKASKRGKMGSPPPVVEAPKPVVPILAPAPPSSDLGVKFAGTTYGLASPEPESLPMPTGALLTGPVVKAATVRVAADPVATSALRGLLQLEVEAATSRAASACLPSNFTFSQANAVMA